MSTISPSAAIVGLAVALGIGLIVGIERERRKGDGDRRAAAGLRTFAIVALAGAVAQILPGLALVPIGRSSPRWRPCPTGRAARRTRA